MFNTEKIQDVLFNMAVRATQNRYFHQVMVFQNCINGEANLNAPCLDVFAWKDSLNPNRWVCLLHEGFMHHRENKNPPQGGYNSSNPQIGRLTQVTLDFPRLRLISIEGVLHPFKVWRNNNGQVVLQSLVIRSIDVRAMFTKLVHKLEVHKDCPDITCHNAENTRMMVRYSKIRNSLCRQIMSRVETLMIEMGYMMPASELEAQDQARLDNSSPDVVD